jgi:hypothetical protein
MCKARPGRRDSRPGRPCRPRGRSRATAVLCSAHVRAARHERQRPHGHRLPSPASAVGGLRAPHKDGWGSPSRGKGLRVFRDVAPSAESRIPSSCTVPIIMIVLRTSVGDGLVPWRTPIPCGSCGLVLARPQRSRRGREEALSAPSRGHDRLGARVLLILDELRRAFLIRRRSPALLPLAGMFADCRAWGPSTRSCRKASISTPTPTRAFTGSSARRPSRGPG